MQRLALMLWLMLAGVLVAGNLGMTWSDWNQPNEAVAPINNKDKDGSKDKGKDKDRDRDGDKAGDKDPTIWLSDGVEWTTGEVLILIPATSLSDEEFAKLSEQVGHVHKDQGDKLIGGSVFVLGRTRLEKWPDWQKNSTKEVFAFGEPELIQTFKMVGAALATIRQKRGGASSRTLVLWHSTYCPINPPPGLVEIRQAQVIWSGKEPGEQQQCVTLDKVFGSTRVTTHGPEITGLAECVKNVLLRPLPPDPDGK